MFFACRETGEEVLTILATETSRLQGGIPSVGRRLAWSLALGSALIYLAFLPPGIYSVDGNSMLAVSESLVTNHSLAVPPGLGIPGRGGEIYSPWYPLQSLLAIPFVLGASAVSQVLHVPLHFLAAALAGVLPALYTAATVALVALISLQLGGTLQGARGAALCFAAGTIALVYARSFYAEPLLAVLVAGGIYLAFVRSRRTILLAALFAMLALLAKPSGILLAPALTAYLFLKKTSPLLAITPAAGGALGFFLYSLYNFIRFGHLLDFGPRWEFSLSALPVGLLGQFLSPGRGLLWYSPAVLLAVLGFRRAWKTKPLEVLLITSLFVGFLGLHAAVPYWHGGWSWGPRYLLPALPGLLALTGLLDGKAARALVYLSFLGFLVNAPSLVSFYERYYAEANEQEVSDAELYWSPASAPLLHGWSAAAREIADASHQDVREIFRQRDNPSRKIASSRALRVVALWWWVLPIVNIPRSLGVACSLAMVILGAWLLLATRFFSSEMEARSGVPPSVLKEGEFSSSEAAGS
jgi:hypothetical protein